MSGRRGFGAGWIGIATALFGTVGLRFMVFVLLYTPCLAVIAVMKKEFASEVDGLAVFYQLAVAWAVSALIFQGGRLLGL